MPTTQAVRPQRVILETLTAQQIHALLVIVRADGHAVRSNYSADTPHRGQWPVFWKTIDWLVEAGLVMRVGGFYSPTVRGEELASQARGRR